MKEIKVNAGKLEKILRDYKNDVKPYTDKKGKNWILILREDFMAGYGAKISKGNLVDIVYILMAVEHRSSCSVYYFETKEDMLNQENCTGVDY